MQATYMYTLYKYIHTIIFKEIINSLCKPNQRKNIISNAFQPDAFKYTIIKNFYNRFNLQSRNFIYEYTTHKQETMWRLFLYSRVILINVATQLKWKMCARIICCIIRHLAKTILINHLFFGLMEYIIHIQYNTVYRVTSSFCAKLVQG